MGRWEHVFMYVACVCECTFVSAGSIVCHIWKCYGISFLESPFISPQISLNIITCLIFLRGENVKML